MDFKPRLLRPFEPLDCRGQGGGLIKMGEPISDLAPPEHDQRSAENRCVELHRHRDFNNGRPFELWERYALARRFATFN